MQTSKLVKLIFKIFVSAMLASIAIFFLSIYVDNIIANIIMPVGAHVVSTLEGSVSYALYNGMELSLFFTTFTLLVIRLSMLSGSILTLRDIVRYYKKFIITTVVGITLLSCILCVIVLNVYHSVNYVSNVLVSGNIISYILPFFWFILAAIYYKGYQSKITETDGSKDRSWLEGNIEN